MHNISIQFFGPLNDFLAPGRRRKRLVRALNRRASIKDLIESFNVPHTEVETIVINGQPKDFSYIVRATDDILVYATEAEPGTIERVKLRPDRVLPPMFVIDCNLGKLARYLRLLGFDALYSNTYTDSTVAHIAASDNRILLTRDRPLLQHRVITYGYFVRAVDPWLQLAEVIARFDLQPLFQPFSRCTRCNEKLRDVEKEAILDQLEPKTIQYYQHFKQCPGCKQIYWPGGHYQRALDLMRSIREPEPT